MNAILSKIHGAFTFVFSFTFATLELGELLTNSIDSGIRIIIGLITIPFLLTKLYSYILDVKLKRKELDKR
jgi:uncharacterized membrane protein (DUF485 family)